MSETDVSSSVFDTTIPITHSPSPDDVPEWRPVPQIEKQMAKEEEQIFREWDENVKCRKQSSFHVRPTSTSGTDKRRRRSNRMTKSASDTYTPGSNRFEFPEIDIIRREDTNFSTSNESLEDDARKQYYMESPVSGQRMFVMEFDVLGYDQKNISVKVSGSRLIVHAMQQEMGSGRKSTTELCRKVKLPGDIDMNRLQCNCNNGKLVVQAPAPIKGNMSGPATPIFMINSQSVEPLNKPIYKDNPLGKFLSLTVEIGRVFQADDVIVKVKSQDKLIIQAKREEEGDKSKMTATMTREFDLDKKIIPQSLKAGLTNDGLLKITAQVLVEVRVITNGIDEEDENQSADQAEEKSNHSTINGDSNANTTGT